MPQMIQAIGDWYIHNCPLGAGNGLEIISAGFEAEDDISFPSAPSFSPGSLP